MEIIIKTQEEYDNAVKQRLHKGNEIVLKNTDSFIDVRTDVTVAGGGRCRAGGDTAVKINVKENGIATAEGKAEISGYGNAQIIARGNCKITLNDNASGHIQNNCHVTLQGKSKISASDNCTVHAHDESEVSAFGKCKIHTYQNAIAKGTDVVSITGKDTSTLSGQKKCSINAQDNCVVFATDACTVQAKDDCMIVANKNANIITQDNCVVMSNDNPNITVMDQAEHFNLDTITDKNIMGCLKRLSKSKAFMERPYISLQLLMNNIPPAQKELVNRRLVTMGCRDQVSTKNFLYNLIEVDSPSRRNQGGHNHGMPYKGHEQHKKASGGMER